MILSRLDRRRFDPVLVCPTDGPLSSRAEDLEVGTRAIEPLKARFTLRPDKLFRYLTSFSRLIRATRETIIREAPDIIHANSIRGGLVISAATFGLSVQVIWHAHDLLPRHPLSVAIRFFSLLSGSNHILAVSKAVAERFRGSLLKLFPRRVPITVIHNGVDVETFHPVPKLRREIRSELGLDQDAPVIAIVGQLTKRKGQLELIESFASFAKELPNSVLLIIGEAMFNRDHDYFQELRTRTLDLGIADRVKFLGQREDIPALMNAIDLLVVNSRKEPFGLTVVEAMAVGIPVVATNVDGIAEIIEPGVTGWLVDPTDKDQLSARILKTLRNPEARQQVSDRALSEVRLRFAAERFMSDLHLLYSGLDSKERLAKRPHPTAQPTHVYPET